MKRPDSRNIPVTFKVSTEQKAVIRAAMKAYGAGFILAAFTEVCRQILSQFSGVTNHEAQ